MLLNEEVRMVNVPRLPELSAIKLGRDVAEDPLLKLYLPDMGECTRQLNRQYLFNVRLQRIWLTMIAFIAIDHQHSQA